MTNSQKLSKLVERFGKSIEVFERKRLLGFIPLTISHGWLWIRYTNDYWAVILANGKTTHQALFGPVLGADFRKDNGGRKVGPRSLTGAWKSAISMWPVKNEEEANRIFNHIASKIDLAYRHHLAVPARV